MKFFPKINDFNLIKIRTLLNNFFFANNLPQLFQKDYTKQIFVTFGLDSINAMGIQTV